MSKKFEYENWKITLFALVVANRFSGAVWTAPWRILWPGETERAMPVAVKESYHKMIRIRPAERINWFFEHSQGINKLNYIFEKLMKDEITDDGKWKIDGKLK